MTRTRKTKVFKTESVQTEVDWATILVHPAAETMPLMPQKEFDALVRDIDRTKRVIEPLVTYEGKLLDGRHRRDAWLVLTKKGTTIDMRAIELSVHSPEFVGDPEGFVLSANLHRRQLTVGQRAIIAARNLERFAADAKVRKGKKQEKFPEAGQARDMAGKKYGVSGKYVGQAHKLLSHPDLLAAVWADEKALYKAFEEARDRESTKPTATISAPKEVCQRTEKPKSNKPAENPAAGAPEAPPADASEAFRRHLETVIDLQSAVLLFIAEQPRSKPIIEDDGALHAAFNTIRRALQTLVNNLQVQATAKANGAG